MQPPTPAVVVAAVPTPFTHDGALDPTSARRLFAEVADSGVEALMVAGTTGEFPALTDEERLELFRIAIEAAGTDRVIAHVGAASSYQAASLATRARRLGVTRFAALTPYYLPASLLGVVDYYAAVARATRDAELYAYLFPKLTTTHLSAPEAADIVKMFGLAGLKLSIPGTDIVAELSRLVPPGTKILSGSDGLIAAVAAAGGHGVVSGVSPAAPRPFLELAAAIAAASVDRQRHAQEAVDALVGALGPRISLGKAALASMGRIASERCRMAIDPATGDERRTIANVLSAVAVAG
jgi:4-hydroxy-tetrahydrodipicolinate synthase